MTTFPTVIDPKEMDLIDKVAKLIEPNAWDDQIHIEALRKYATNETAAAQSVREINEFHRARVREIAIEIMEIIRAHDADRKAEREGA